MRILITAGPTREYLDDVRYLSNASSGRMGYAIAEAAREQGHDVVLVSGPVEISPPKHCEVVTVETTSEMKDAAIQHLSRCDGVIASAAVCDYKPARRIEGKMSKTGAPIVIDLIETDDVLAELGVRKEDRWIIGFALEAQNPRENALQKLRRKNCDYIVLNHPSAIGAASNQIELLDEQGEAVAEWSGPKTEIAASLMTWIGKRFTLNR